MQSEGGQYRMSDTCKAFIEGNRICFKVPYKYKDLAKTIPTYRWNGKKKHWTYQLSPLIAYQIKRLNIQIETTDEFDELVQSAKEIKNAQKLKEKEDLPEVPNTKFNAWTHQKQAYHFAKKLHSAMLAMDMGTGKTKVTIDLIVNRGHKRTLVVCPLSAISVWPKEIKKHTIKGTKIRAIPLNKRSTDERMKYMNMELRKAEAHNEQAVVIINYDVVYYDNVKSALEEADFDLMVTDESHRIKAPGGSQSLACYRIGKKIPYKLALTGTPMPHSPMDIYAQYRFLDPAIYGSSFNRFKNRYGIYGGYGGYELLGFQNQAEMNKKFYFIAYKCDSDEVQDLPDKIDINRTADLSKAGMKKYKELERMYYTQFKEGEELTALNALSKLLRLQQLTSGYLPDDDGKIHTLDNSKQELLDDIMKDLAPEEPIVVFARFTYDLNRIKEVAEANNRSYAELSGGRDDLQAWQNGEYNTIGVQIKSGSLGVDLTRSRYAIYYSMGYSLGDYRQSRKRIHRPGQEKDTRFIHLLINNTVDIKTMNAIKQKKEIIDYILEEVNSGRGNIYNESQV